MQSESRYSVLNVRGTVKKPHMVKVCGAPRGILCNAVALVREVSRYQVLEVLDAGLGKEFALDDVGRF